MRMPMAITMHRLCLTLVLLTGMVFAQARTYLVSVGISDYPGTDNDLSLPVKDAQTISWLYGRNSAVVQKQLFNQQATRQNILSAISGLFAQATANDIIVFFYSGHGYQGGFVAYDGYLSFNQVRKAMAKSKCKNKMIFADACFSGKFRQDGASAQDDNSAEGRSANVLLFLSSRSNETSIERPAMQNGFFTTYLQKGLRGNADANRDRTITARELFDFVSNGVARISNGKQHPVMWGHFRDDMPVMVW